MIKGPIYCWLVGHHIWSREEYIWAKDMVLPTKDEEPGCWVPASDAYCVSCGIKANP